MANILILRSANTSDKDIKTGVAEVELENGFGVALGEVSTNRKEMRLRYRGHMHFEI